MIVQISFSSFRELKSNSHETPCYSANLKVNGRKIGMVSNSGTGGCCDFDPSVPNGWEIYQALRKAWVDAHGKYAEFTFPLIDETIHFRKELRVRLAGTTYREGEYHIFPCSTKNRQEREEILRKKYPDAVIFSPKGYLEIDIPYVLI